MLFSKIQPYVRYARQLNLCKDSHFIPSIPLDARLFYTSGGHGTIYVKNKEYEMPQFSLLVINSGIPYQIASPEKSVSYLALNFDYTLGHFCDKTPIPPVSENEFSRKMCVEHITFSDAPELSEVLYIRRIPSIQGKLNTVLNEYTQKLLFHENKTGHILAQCLTESMRFVRTGGVGGENEAGNKILSYVHENYRGSITNRSIGAYFGYHPNYVSFLIKQLTGMPSHQYIIHLRLMHAVRLLENTSLSCEEIALQCGFCDCAYFSRYFKNQFGTAPSKYRSL